MIFYFWVLRGIRFILRIPTMATQTEQTLGNTLLTIRRGVKDLENNITMLEGENRRLEKKVANLIRCLGNVFMYKEDLPSVLEEGEEPPMKKGHFVIHTCHYNGMADIYKFETEEEQQAVMAYLDGSEGDITCSTQLTNNSDAKSMKYFREESVEFEEEEEEEKTEE